MDGITPVLDSKIKKARSLKPVMRKVEKLFAAEIAPAWQRSGLHSRSGKLAEAITTFAGKKSVGITIKNNDVRTFRKAKAHSTGKGPRGRRYPERPFAPAHSVLREKSRNVVPLLREHFR